MGDSRSWTETGSESRLEVRAFIPALASGDVGEASQELRLEDFPPEPSAGLAPATESGISGAGLGAATPVAEDGAPGAPAYSVPPGIRDDGTGPYLWEDEWRELLRVHAPAEWVEDLVTITVCESGRFEPDSGRWYVRVGAVGDHGASRGAPQMAAVWYRGIGVDPDGPGQPWRDADVQARAAVFVRENRGRYGGAGGWTCADLRGIP